jgi:hypothetical protein
MSWRRRTIGDGPSNIRCYNGAAFTPQDFKRGDVAMGIQIVFETHSISEDNEHGIATGWRDNPVL